MKKLVLLFIVLLGVSCEKSETYDNPYYTKEQQAILTELCASNGWIPPKGSTAVGAWYFVTIDNKPFNIQYKDSDTEIQADGIAYFHKQTTWFYFYYKLISNTEIQFFDIKYTLGNYGVLDDIIANRPPYTNTMQLSFRIWTEDENYTYLNLEGQLYFRR